MAYLFPLSIQLTLPEAYRKDEHFRQVLESLQQHGFSGVELNIVRLEQIDPQELKSFLYQFDLKMTMFASGAAAKASGLSLSSADEDLRARSIAGCEKFIEFVGQFDAGVIVGFLKGGPAQDREKARRAFQESLRAIAPRARELQVPVLIEATNRYEAAVANSLDDTFGLIAAVGGNPFIKMLPDTFHMNIEERDQFDALTRHAALYDSLHISDNNRHFPGFGAIRFDRIVDFLRDMGYRGGITIEGNIKEDLISDIRKTMKYLEPILREEE